MSYRAEINFFAWCAGLLQERGVRIKQTNQQSYKTQSKQQYNRTTKQQHNVKRSAGCACPGSTTWRSGISRIRFSPFYESFWDSSNNLWFKKKTVFVSSNWGPVTVSFYQFRWNPLGERRPRGPVGAAGARCPGGGAQGFQGYSFCPSTTNHCKILREIVGLRRFVCYFLRIGAP